MSAIQVQVMDQGQLDKMQALLAGIPNGVEKASRSAMQRGASNLRSNSAKAIQERYDISTGNIRANENVAIRYSYQEGDVQAFVVFRGQKIPLYRYNGASPGAPTVDKSRWIHVMIGGEWKTVHPSVSAKGHQLKNKHPAMFAHAFVAQMSNGHTGIFSQNGGASQTDGDSVSEIMGGSVPGMLSRDEIKEKLGEQASKVILDRYEHEVIRLLNGWGG